MSQPNVIVTTLRRSGSTIFWRCFREATDAVCFDEPYNPGLIQLPQPHEKNVYGPYIDLLAADSSVFWDKFAPVSPLNELEPTFECGQEEWLRWLLGRSEPVFIDTTRCWNKIDQLAKSVGGETFVIHLHRSPAGFAASHLLPSDLKSSILGRWHLFKRRRNFFDLNTGFNYWNLEDVVGYGPGSAYSAKMLDGSVSADRLYSWNAPTRLLHFWKKAYDQAERVGQQAFGNRFLSVSYERFCRKTRGVLAEIQDQTGLGINLSELPTVRSPSSIFREGDERWYEAAEKVGLATDPQMLFRCS